MSHAGEGRRGSLTQTQERRFMSEETTSPPAESELSQAASDKWVILFTSNSGNEWETAEGTLDEAVAQATYERRHLMYSRNGFRIVPDISPSWDGTLKGAPGRQAEWIPGDKPETPKGSSTQFWVTVRRRETGRLGVLLLKWNNAYVMGCSPYGEPPDCAVPLPPNDDADGDEYAWTCWTTGYCEDCEVESLWDDRWQEIIAHMPVEKPSPFQP